MMEQNKQAPEEKDRSGSLVRKIWGNNPRVSAMMVMVIVTLCFVLGFSKETMQNYEAVLRKGLGMESGEGCPAGWVSYRHDVVGVSFCYPGEWGDVKIEPKEPVTRLADLLEDHAGTEDGYRDSFLILFGNNEDIAIRVFNENYGGEKYAGDPTATGFVDNIGVLKETAKVCNYEKNYGYKGNFAVRIKETYAECGNGIKTVINDTQETSNERIDTSVLESFAYAQLSNGYFDHMLINLAYGDTVKLGTEYASIDSLLPVLGLEKGDFKKKEGDFTTFVRSITAFAPKAESRAEFAAAEGEDGRVTLIRRYYHLIESGRLGEAFTLKEDGGNFEDFAKTYEDAYVAEAHDFSDSGGDVFSFAVRYQDHNEPAKEYAVRMAVSGGKLRTISVEETAAESVSYGGYTALVAEKEGKEYLLLRKGKDETVVDAGSDYSAEAKAAGFGEKFSGLAFSADGRYLLYSSRDYEYGGSCVYDVEGKKGVMEIPGAEIGSGFGFTPDGRYFYFCTSAGMVGGDPGKVYTVPGFEQVFDAARGGSDKYLVHSCSYDEARKAIIFTATDPGEESLPKSVETEFEAK